LLKEETSLNALGTHFLVELNDCNSEVLRDLKFIEEALLSAAKKANARVVESRFHQFSPFGISGLVVIAESHLSIHTWPEHRYAAVDIFTCGESLKPHRAIAHLVEKLESLHSSIVELKRGLFSKKGTPLEFIAFKEGETFRHVSGKILQMVL